MVLPFCRKCANTLRSRFVLHVQRALIADVVPHLLPIFDHYPHNVQRADAVRYAILYKCVVLISI
jgi:hypothetical protein